MALAGARPSQTPGRWSKIAPLFGLLFVAFVVASVLVGEHTSHQRLTRLDPPLLPGLISTKWGYRLLIPPAVLFGLVWFSYLRNWLQRRDVDQRWAF